MAPWCLIWPVVYRHWDDLNGVNIVMLAVGWFNLIFICAIAILMFFTDIGPFKSFYFGNARAASDKKTH